MVLNVLIIGHHIVECVVKLIRTSLDLQLLPVDLILNVVNSLIELGDVHLSVLKLGFSDLVLVLQGVDLLNELLFPLQSLLSRLLKLLHVLTNSLKLILDSLQVLLSQLSPLHSPLKLSFMFSPTVSSSSSIPFRFFSASSALSTALLSSASCSHQQSQAHPRFPSGSSQPAQPSPQPS